MLISPAVSAVKFQLFDSRDHEAPQNTTLVISVHCCYAASEARLVLNGLYLIISSNAVVYYKGMFWHPSPQSNIGNSFSYEMSKYSLI